MALGPCTICKEQQARYKCPKCVACYCSIQCFKSPVHDSLHKEQQRDTTDSANPTKVAISAPRDDTKYANLFQDEKLRYLLSFKALQIHLRSIYEIITDMTLTPDKRLDMANDKLNSLRTAGVEENELVEEFCERVTELLEANK